MVGSIEAGRKQGEERKERVLVDHLWPLSKFRTEIRSQIRVGTCSVLSLPAGGSLTQLIGEWVRPGLPALRLVF